MMPAKAEKERRLVHALRMLAEADSPAQPAPELERKLLAALREPRHMRPVRWGWVAALAAAIALLMAGPGFLPRTQVMRMADTGDADGGRCDAGGHRAAGRERR